MKYSFPSLVVRLRVAGAAGLCALAGACTTLPQTVVPAKPTAGALGPTMTDNVKMVRIQTELPEFQAGSLIPEDCDGVTAYKPMPAFPAPNYTHVTTEDNVRARVRAWPSSNGEKNNLLPNIATDIRVEDLPWSASLGGFATTDHKDRRITIDFMKYRSEPVIDGSGRPPFYARVGAGLRVTMEVASTDYKLNGAGLLPILLSASKGQLKGHITADVIGMNASDVTMAMPFTSDLSDQSIVKIIEAAAIIRSKLHEKDTYLDPHFIARIECIRKEDGDGKK